METGNDSSRKEDRGKRLKKQPSRPSSLEIQHSPKEIENDKGKGKSPQVTVLVEGEKLSTKPKNRKRQKLRGKELEEDEDSSIDLSDRGSEGSEGCPDLGLDDKGKSKKKQKGSSHEEDGGGAKVVSRQNNKCHENTKKTPKPFTKKKSSISLDNLSVMDQIGEVFTNEDTGFLSEVAQTKRNFRANMSRDWSTSCVYLVGTPGERKKKKEAEEDSKTHRVDFSRSELKEVPFIPRQSKHAIDFVVDLSHNYLSSSSLFSLNIFPAGITSLQLNNNNLTALPPGFPFALQNLRVLSLSHNQLSELPLHLGDLVDLENLILDHNCLTHLPPSLGRLTNLVKFDLGHNYLQRLPESIGDLALINFRVNHNELTSFPNSFSNLNQLRYLLANHNRLRFISPLLFRLPNLRRMVLSDNDLQNMSEFVTPTSPLTTLSLERNSLESVPLLLSHLRKLETFSIQGNPFQDPFDVWVERETRNSHEKGEKDDEKEGKKEKGEKEEKSEGSIEKERVLVGEENHRHISLRLLKKLRKVPDQWLSIYTAACRGDSVVIEDLLGEGVSLDIQDPWGYTPLAHAIEQGRMEAITTLLALGASPELEKLEPGSLSPAVKKLLNLYRLGKEEKEIDLSGCGLTKLPKRVLEFPFLVSLNLKDNMLEILPPALSSLQYLQTLQLEGNPLSLCPMEGLSSTKEVLSEMKKTVEVRTEEWVHMKVMYLGNPGVGKTSVARAVAGTSTNSRLRSDSDVHPEKKEAFSDYPPPSPSSLNSAPPPTMALEVTKWKSSGIHFTCWDPSCRPYFLPVLPFMMTRGAVCVIVFSLNDAEMESAIRKWLNFIAVRHGRPYLSVILVGTHSDLENDNVTRNIACWEETVRKVSQEFRCIRGKVFCCVEDDSNDGVSKLRDILIRLSQTRMEAAPSSLKLVSKSCLNFLARINSYRNRFLVSAPFVMEIADECGIPPERVDEYIQLFVTGGFYLMSPGGRWLVVDVQMLFDLFGTLFQRRSDARRMRGVFGTHLVTSLKANVPLPPMDEAITILQDYAVVLKLQPAVPVTSIPHDDISSFLHSLSLSGWRTKVQPQNAPSLNYTYIVLPEFLPAEKPEYEQFIGMFLDLPPICQLPFERLFMIPSLSYGLLSRIFVRFINQPHTHCLLAWKEGIMIQRINPIGQKGGRFGRSRACGRRGNRKGLLNVYSLRRDEMEFAVRDIVVLEYNTSISKLKLTVFSTCALHHYLTFQLKEIISLIEATIFDLLPGISLEQEVLCRHCRKQYWGKLGRGKFRKLFMGDTFDDCTVYSYEDLRAASVTGGSFVQCKRGGKDGVAPLVSLDTLVPEVEWKHTRTLSADRIRLKSEDGEKMGMFSYGTLEGENGKFSVAVQSMTTDFASAFAELATICHNTTGAHGCGVAGVRGIGGFSCYDSRGVGMKWMYESVQRRIQSLGYLRHPNLAHLIGSLNQYPLRVLWRWEKCENLSDFLGHFWKTKIRGDYSKYPRIIKRGTYVTILSMKENVLAFGRQGNKYFKVPVSSLEGEPKEKISFENRMRIILDIARALNALHTHTYPPITHGYLSSSSVFIKKDDSGDCRAFLAGHGMKGFIRPPASLNEDLWRWTSPELLLFPAHILSQSELMAHDVYSFGMMMYELLFQRVPYDSAATDVRTWSDHGSFDSSLCMSAILYSKHRPVLSDSVVPSEYIQLMEQCWHADPKQRPVFPDIYNRLLNILKGEKEAAMVYTPLDPAPQLEPITPVSNLIHVLNPHGAVLAIGTPHTGWAETPEEMEKENYLWVGTDKGKVVIVDGKNGEIVKTLSVMWKSKGEKDTDDFRTYWVAPSPTCPHHMWCVDEDGSLTCFDVKTYNIVGRAVGSGAFTKSVLIVPLQCTKRTDKKPFGRSSKSPSFEKTKSKKKKSRSVDPSEPIHIPKNQSYSFADLAGASQHLPYSSSSTVKRPVSSHSQLPHSLSSGSPRVSPRYPFLSPPSPSPSSTSSSSSSPPSPNPNESRSQHSASPPPSPSSHSPPPSPHSSSSQPTPLPSASSSSPFPANAPSTSSSFLSVDSSNMPPAPTPPIPASTSHPCPPPTSSASLPALPSVSPPPLRSSVLNPSARDTLPLSLPAATQSFMANHPNTASVSLFSVVKNESEVKFESKFVEISPEREKGPFDYEVWVGRSDAVLNVLGVKQSPDSEFVVEGIGEITIPDAVLCMCAVRGVEIWVGSPIAIFRISISSRKLVDSIQTKDMRTPVSCMAYVDNTGEVWTSDDAGAGIVSVRSSRSGRTKEMIDLDGDKVTSMSVVGEQLLCGTFRGSIIIFDSRRYTVLQTLLKSHHSSVRCFANTPNAFWSGGRDKALCAWSIRWCEDDPTLYKVESGFQEKEEGNKNRKSWARRFFPKF